MNERTGNYLSHTLLRIHFKFLAPNDVEITQIS